MDAVGLSDALTTLFASVSRDRAAAERCLSAANGLRYGSISTAQPAQAQLVRSLMALADRLVAFDAAACAAIAAAPLRHGSPAAIQIQAATVAATACLHLAISLPLRHDEALRIATVARVSLHSGAALAAAAAAHLTATRSSGAVREAQLVQLFEGRGRLPEWMHTNFLGLLSQLTYPEFARHYAALAANPSAVESLMNLLLHHTLPAFAAAAEGRPSALQLPAGTARTLDGQEVSAAPLHMVMPFISCLSRALSMPCLARAAGACVRRPGGLASLQQALRLAAALPSTVPAGMSIHIFGEGHGSAMQLLQVLCLVHNGHLFRHSAHHVSSLATSASSPTGSQGDEGAEQWQAAACELLKALPRLLGTLRSLAGAEACLAEDLSKISHVLATVIKALFKMEPTIGSEEAAVAWAEAAAAGPSMLPLLCQLDAAWQQQQDWPPFLRGAAGGLAFCLLSILAHDGAASALRWEGRRRAQRAQRMQRDALDEPSPLGSLPIELVWRLHSASCRAVHFLLVDQHAAMLQRAPEVGLPLGHRCLDTACLVFVLARKALGTASIQTDSIGAEATRRALRAVCAAQVEAVRAAAVAAQRGPFLAMGDTTNAMGSLLQAGVTCPLLVDASFAELLAWAHSRLPSVGQLDSHSAPQMLLCLVDWVTLISRQPRLLAAAACNGMLRTLLSELAAVAGRANAHVPGQCAFKLGSALFFLADGAGQAAEAVAEGRAPAAHPAGTAGAAGHLGSGEEPAVLTAMRRAWARYRDAPEYAARLTQAAKLLLASLRELGVESAGVDVMAGQRTPLDPLPGLVQRWPQVLGPAQTFCELLLLHWAQPEQLAAARLELAQAAAARSCGYLRCTNVGLEGGPAAGQGAGSKRCSGCRVAWYCDTACSHADWRQGGHRQACAALAAARQGQAAEQGGDNEGVEAQ